MSLIWPYDGDLEAYDPEDLKTTRDVDAMVDRADTRRDDR